MKTLNLSTLSQSEKKQIWDHIQKKHPELQSIINDLEALKNAFNAELIIEIHPCCNQIINPEKTKPIYAKQNKFLSQQQKQQDISI